MQVTHRRFDYKNGEDFGFVPLFDVHWGARACDEAAFRRTVRIIRERRYWWWSGGDLAEYISVRDIKRFKAGVISRRYALDDIDELPKIQTAELAEILEPISGRCLGIGKGNHEASIADHGDYDPAKELAKALSAPYLGFEAYIQLVFRQRSGQGRTYTILSKHQYTFGGEWTGNDINAIDRAGIGAEADIYVGGHTHKLVTIRGSRLALKGIGAHADLSDAPKLLILAGSYRKTKMRGVDEYTDKKKFTRPVPIGSALITLHPATRGMKAVEEVA